MQYVPLKPTLYRHPHGITAIDTEYLYPGHAAAHLIVDQGSAAFVDVGPNSSVPYLLGALDELGIAREAVGYVLLTHVHLDHAGGAGALTAGTDADVERAGRWAEAKGSKTISSTGSSERAQRWRLRSTTFLSSRTLPGQG